MTSYLVEDRQYRYILEKLCTENPFVLEGMRFRMDCADCSGSSPTVFLCKDGEERPLQPYSSVLKDGSEQFQEYDTGEGKEHLLEALKTAGVAEDEAKNLVDTVYDILPDWLVLPASAVDTLVKERQVPYDIIEHAQKFLKWLDEDGEEDVGNVGNNQGNNDKQELEETKRAFQTNYFPMSEGGWNNMYEKAMAAATKTFAETVPAGGSMTFRADQGKLYVSSEDFETEKECLTSTDAHVPPRLRGFRLGHGPTDLLANLVNRGMDTGDARGVAEQVYSYVDDHICLPPTEIDALRETLQGKVVMIRASMLNAANDYAKWVFEHA